MSKNYLYSILFFLVLGTAFVAAQDTRSTLKESNSIEGLSFYPNPVTGGKLYITTRANEEKNITIYDVLGKKVFQTVLSSRELNLSTLQPGVYFIKIEEGEASATRKLIVR
ncbi:Por secretion system C-terminal sorting domain-containing protein [Flavobacterium fontis]|uniref:Por secretion system C-terminal sorting domain-containing protein n=1 Tax=Flavobacterium fontis TaxID=1124188 RepID=A0A1M4WRG3_9FLAO|nr:T9SS type A sorting domain-containing protein [Flavobacterium fontis]SHE83881.1 Por secretion system C-terminal sorting domain-containing protein [Flavobacterium fontis]